MTLRIKELREEYRFTQKELAEKISNAQRNVSNWEKGISEPDCATILKLAELFNVSLDELFGRDQLQTATEMEEPLYRMIARLSKEQKDAVVNLIQSITR